MRFRCIGVATIIVVATAVGIPAATSAATASLLPGSRTARHRGPTRPARCSHATWRAASSRTRNGTERGDLSEWRPKLQEFRGPLLVRDTT
jgi:hypothetical protein